MPKGGKLIIMAERSKIVKITSIGILFVFFAVLFAISAASSTDTGTVVWNLLEQMDSSAVRMEGKTESEEYPFGYNVGYIEDEKVEKAVLITPNTSIEISGTVLGKSSLNMIFGLHPWVAMESDGALLNVSIVSEEICRDFVFHVDGRIQTEQISLAQFADRQIQVKLYVTNEAGRDENCDWVILQEFSFLNGDFQGKQAEISEMDYVRSATYFADEWPLNFWNSEMDHLDDDMNQIKNDGFDSIILVIPWREFQISTRPVKYSDYAFQKLDDIMKSAKKSHLNVYVRIGYTWDYYSDTGQNIVDQFCSLMGDQELQTAWFAYVEKMYTVLSTYDNFKEGFLTWEDFWNNLGVCDEVDEEIRVEKADFIGYQKWVKDNYSLSEYNQKYTVMYGAYEDIPVPQRDEPAMEAMYAFYDNFLNMLLKQSQERFPNLSMEVRMDWDVIYRSDNTLDYYKHTDTFSCMDSDFTVTMYGIPMGFENIGEKVGYREAMEKTQYILQQFRQQNGGKPVYIDQFIFADNTPKFKNNAQIRNQEINDYLVNVKDILLEFSDGYGIWTYRNYCTNMLYNSQFALGTLGWEASGGVVAETSGNSNVCMLKRGQRICQTVPEIRNHFDSEKYQFQFEVVRLDAPGLIKVSVGNNTQEIEIMQTGKVSLDFEKNESFDVAIETVDCELAIDNLKLFSQVQQGFLYDENNNELQCCTGIRNLNAGLQAGK